MNRETFERQYQEEWQRLEHVLGQLEKDDVHVSRDSTRFGRVPMKSIM